MVSRTRDDELTGRSSARWERVAGGAGILAALGVAAAVAVQPSVDPARPAAAVVAALASHRAGELAGVYLQTAAAIPFLCFLAALAAALRRGERPSPLLADLALGCGIVALALVLAAQGVLGTLLAFLVDGAPPEVVRGLYAAFRGVFTAADLFLGAFLLAAALGLRAAGRPPRGLGWLGVGGGAASILGAFSFAGWHGPLELLGFLGLLALLVWLALTGAWLLRGAARPAPAAALGAAQ